MTMCCPIDGGDDYPAQALVQDVVKAAKGHSCTECHEVIPSGSQYERTKGLWDGAWSTYKTCLSCVEIRNHFVCGHGWVFGEVWAQLEDNFFPDMKAGGPCMEGLSPAAKERLFVRRMAWLEASR